MITKQETQHVIGSTAYSAEGDKIGKVDQIYLNDQTEQPEFASINAGLFGTAECFVPLQNANFEDNRLVLPFNKEKVKDSPNVHLNGDHLDQSEEQKLYQYYGLSYYDTTPDTYGTNYDTRNSSSYKDNAMTRSEEQLHVGTKTEEVGKARLRKYVTTEQESVTVPVRKEKAVLETEPVTDATIDSALNGPAISEEEHEIVLTEERPVVDKEVTPVERVKLGTTTEVQNETITENIRKEHIELDGTTSTNHKTS